MNLRLPLPLRLPLRSKASTPRATHPDSSHSLSVLNLFPAPASTRTLPTQTPPFPNVP
jgi:hypothetical protein